jgi:hypothetical protein
MTSHEPPRPMGPFDMTAGFSTLRPLRRRSVTLALTGAVTISSALLGVTPADAAVTQSPATTYQVDGSVSAMVVVGNRVYVGGHFLSVRPAGAPVGTGEISRRGLAAFNRTTGALLPWNPSVNSQVNALAASPNGRVIYVGGRFGRVDGRRRANLAAVHAGSGHVTRFRADTSGRVLAIATHGHTVYVGGKFTHLGRRVVGHVAALTSGGRSRRSFHASASGFVRSIALGPGGRSLFLGGDFRRVDRRRSVHLAKLSRASGRLRRLHGHPSYPVNRIVAHGHRLFLAGNGIGGHVGSYTTSGKRRWVRQVDGNVAAVALIRRTVYVGGQFHNLCVGTSHRGGPGFTCPTVEAGRQRLLALSTSHGALAAWNPGANSVLGVFSLVGTPSGLHVGGEFTELGSSAQQGYGRFDHS